MPDQFSRTCLMLGKENMQRLQHARVAVFGIGGVGGYVVEGLVRSGIGTFDLIDHDQICLSNLNRQIIATRKTIGKYKVDVAKERILEINPEASVNIYKIFFCLIRQTNLILHNMIMWWMPLIRYRENWNLFSRR